MTLLFSQQPGDTYWFFTGTFPTRDAALAYVNEYFGTGTFYKVCDQDKVELTPSCSWSVD